MSRQATALASEAPARRFSREIADALQSGRTAEEMTLHLTLMDASKIKRDPDLPVEDISFSPEGMRFLGVRVVEGGVRSSGLNTDGSPVEMTPPPEPKKKAKAKAPAKPRAKSAKAKAAAEAADAQDAAAAGDA